MRKFLLLFCLMLTGCPVDGPSPGGTISPTPIPEVGALTVCPDKVSFCYEGRKVWLRAFSAYGAFSIPYDYDVFLDKLKSNNINLMREWATVYPTAWGGQNPYLFSNGVATLNPLFWSAAHHFLHAAGQRGIWVVVDLTDRYGAETKEFATSPWNSKHGGPLSVGLPELYTNPAVIQTVRLGVQELSKHKNVIYIVCNEPSRSESLAQLENFHRAMIQMIREVHGSDYRLVGVNMIPDDKKRPIVPNPTKVGADFATLHGASVENPKDRNSCKPDQVAARLAFIQRLIGTALLNDDDGLYAKNVPCHRYDHTVLQDLANGSMGVAGFIHRGGEPGGEEPVDDQALMILERVVVP